MKQLDTEENRIAGVYSAYQSFAGQILEGGYTGLPARVSLLLLYVREGWTAEAGRLVNELTDNAEDAALLYNLQGQIYLSEGQREQARQSFNKSLELEPDYLGVHLYLSNMAWQAQNYEQCRDQLQKLFEGVEDSRRPFFIPAYIKLARCEDMLGNQNEAVEIYKKVSVKITAGVDTGSKLRLSGEGEASPSVGATGDLYELIKVKI